jgi:hypothetical protein
MVAKGAKEIQLSAPSSVFLLCVLQRFILPYGQWLLALSANCYKNRRCM